MLVHKPYGPSFSGELSVGIGINPLPLFLNSIAPGITAAWELLWKGKFSIQQHHRSSCRDAACSSPTEQAFTWPQNREPPWQVGLQGMIGTKGRNNSV